MNISQKAEQKEHIIFLLDQQHMNTKVKQIKLSTSVSYEHW